MVVPVLVGGGAATAADLFFKSRIEKGFEYEFKVKLKEYKAKLVKKGAGYDMTT